MSYFFAQISVTILNICFLILKIDYETHKTTYYPNANLKFLGL